MGNAETMPRQSQERQPGSEKQMHPRPEYEPRFPGSGRLAGKVAIVTGGDSGIGRAVSVLFAREGANVAIVYKDEHEDAEETAAAIRREGRDCLTIAGDIADEQFCHAAVQETVKRFGGVDVLVNNAAEQHEQETITDIGEHQLVRTFATNVFGYFHMTKAVLPHLEEGDAIVNTTSVTAYKGSGQLLDYASTRGAIVAFTRSLAQQLNDRKIRVNGVAPGPIWTLAVLSRRVLLDRGLIGDCADHGQQVLHPVPELADPEIPRLLRLPASHDVARDLRGADDLAALVADGRDRQGDLHQGSILAPPNRLVVIDPLAASDALEDRGHLVLAAGRSEDGDIATDHLLGGVAEQPLGSAIPAGDDAGQVLARNCIVTVLDDGSQESPFQPRWDGRPLIAGGLLGGICVRTTHLAVSDHSAPVWLAERPYLPHQPATGRSVRPDCWIAEGTTAVRLAPA